MKTFFDIIKDISTLRWSIDEEDLMSFDEVRNDIKQAVKSANDYIWNARNYPFREREYIVNTISGQSFYSAPFGSIKCIYIPQLKRYIKETRDYKFLDNKSGIPNKYWIKTDSTGYKLHLYPNPNSIYNVTIEYYTKMSVRDKNNNEKVNFDDEYDVLNIPEFIEDTYLECLKSRAMMQLIQDINSPFYAPYEKTFRSSYQTLKDITESAEATRIVF